MLEKLDFRKEEVTFSNVENKLIIKKASNTNLTSVMLFGLFSLLIINSVFSYLDEGNGIANFIMLIIGIWCFRKFLWELRGYDIIEIGNNYLNIKKKGSFLMFNNKYEISKIKNVKYKIESYKDFSTIGFNIGEMFSLYLNMIGMESGDILFKYDYQTISVFHGLSIVEKIKIVDEISAKTSLTNIEK